MKYPEKQKTSNSRKIELLCYLNAHSIMTWLRGRSHATSSADLKYFYHSNPINRYVFIFIFVVEKAPP